MGIRDYRELKSSNDIIIMLFLKPQTKAKETATFVIQPRMHSRCLEARKNLTNVCDG